MGIFSKNGWKEWARQWGLTYHAPKFLGSTREWIAGSHRGCRLADVHHFAYN